MSADRENLVRKRATFDAQLQELLDDLTVMVSMADAAIGDAMRSLNNRDQTLAGLVVSADANINQLRFKVGEHCLDLIARQQPNASDLRLIIASMNISLELERIGDHAASIASRVAHLAEHPPHQSSGALNEMSDLAREMLRESLDALLQHDAKAAFAVATRDSQLDTAYEQLFVDVVADMAEPSKDAAKAAHLLFCGHNLERIGDRITNICEHIVFVVTGQMQEMEEEEQEQRGVAPS